MDGDIRRVWKCPVCGDHIRLAVETVAATCDSCKDHKWMQIESEPVLKRFVPPSTDPEDVTEGPPNSSANGVENIFPAVQVSDTPKRKRSSRQRKRRNRSGKDKSPESPADTTAVSAADATPSAETPTPAADSSDAQTNQDTPTPAPETAPTPTNQPAAKDEPSSDSE